MNYTDFAMKLSFKFNAELRCKTPVAAGKAEIQNGITISTGNLR